LVSPVICESPVQNEFRTHSVRVKTGYLSMRLLLICVVAATLGLAHRAAHADGSLNVGDPAPELMVARWVKGKKVEKFNPGGIYVVEFWATWCGPCKQTIPHLTDLGRQYRSKGVTLIGVDVWEPEVKNVKPFVDEMGARMDYSVAVDAVPPGVDPHDGAMARSWLHAAEEYFIPTAFAVQDGKVVWIGNPVNLDKPLTAIVAGTWDTLAFARQREARRVVKRKTANINQRAVPLFKAKKFQEFLKALDEITAGNEAVAKHFAGLKLAAMCNSGDIDAGLALGAKLLEAHNEEPNVLDTIFRPAIDPQNSETPDPRVIALALKAAKRLVALSGEKNPAHLDTLALAQYLGGHPAAAVTSQAKAIKALKPGPQPERKVFNERLQRYRKAADEKRNQSDQ
jgi:thiol-disulfide isomerase/thioredoxin